MWCGVAMLIPAILQAGNKHADPYEMDGWMDIDRENTAAILKLSRCGLGARKPYGYHLELPGQNMGHKSI